MTIANPDHRFRLRLLLWAGNYRGEQPFSSAPQKNLLEVITLVQQIKANKAIDSQVRSYVIQEQMGTAEAPAWETLDYSDWCDLAWPQPTGEAPGIRSAREQHQLGINRR